MRLANKRSAIVSDDSHIVCHVNSVSLPDFTQARREATRPLASRGENFERDFDSTTLVFDTVRIDDRQVALFAPPLFNLARDMAATSFQNGDARYASEIKRRDRHAQIWLNVPDGIDRIDADGPLGAFSFPVSPNQSEMFSDRRVIFTMSKNNPIEWILDWVRFNRDVHGADAVLIYDNGSTAYDAATLSAALRSVSGLHCSVVMEWPFKYGPQGANSWDHWDSDFCQLGAWENARWRFLQHARSAMNSDIDELVVSRSGRSVFEAAEQSARGFVRYRGNWIIGIDDGIHHNASNIVLRHFDYSYLMPPKYEMWKYLIRRDANRCLPKWTIVPKRCPRNAQWHVHSVLSWWASLLTDRDFSFRHFREIGSNWKYQRSNRVALDPKIHVVDRLLEQTYRRVDWNH